MVEAADGAEEARQRAYYDSIATLYDANYGSPSALAYRYWVYDMALSKQQLQGQIALDAMCGGGEGTGYLMGRGASVVGLDISQQCCDLYAARYPNNRIVCSSILTKQFADSSFDLVLTDSLHHVHPHVDQAMNEIYRIMKPGALLCCWEPNAGSWLDLLRRLWYRLDPKFFEQNEKSIHVPQLQQSHKHQFEAVSVHTGGHLAYLLVNCPMALRIPKWAVPFYAQTLMRLERLTQPIQPSITSLWTLGLFRKI